MSLRGLVTILLVISLFLPSASLAGQICFNEEEARKLLIEIKENRTNQEIIAEQEKLISNLKEQNRLLAEQVRLLRESLDLQKKQAELYKTAYEEERKKTRLNLFEKGKWLGLGIMAGLILLKVAF